MAEMIEWVRHNIKLTIVPKAVLLTRNPFGRGLLSAAQRDGTIWRNKSEKQAAKSVAFITLINTKTKAKLEVDGLFNYLTVFRF